MKYILFNGVLFFFWDARFFHYIFRDVLMFFSVENRPQPNIT